MNPIPLLCLLPKTTLPLRLVQLLLPTHPPNLDPLAHPIFVRNVVAQVIQVMTALLMGVVREVALRIETKHRCMHI